MKYNLKVGKIYFEIRVSKKEIILDIILNIYISG